MSIKFGLGNSPSGTAKGSDVHTTAARVTLKRIGTLPRLSVAVGGRTAPSSGFRGVSIMQGGVGSGLSEPAAATD